MDPREPTPPPEGARVRLSPEGQERARQMPEAWGLHRAATMGEVGTVVDAFPADAESDAALSVEFDSGSVHNWPVSCFEPVPGDDY